MLVFQNLLGSSPISTITEFAWNNIFKLCKIKPYSTMNLTCIQTIISIEIWKVLRAIEWFKGQSRSLSHIPTLCCSKRLLRGRTPAFSIKRTPPRAPSPFLLFKWPNHLNLFSMTTPPKSRHHTNLPLHYWKCYLLWRCHTGSIASFCHLT